LGGGGRRGRTEWERWGASRGKDAARWDVKVVQEREQ
jgi:hypothetical protein